MTQNNEMGLIEKCELLTRLSCLFCSSKACISQIASSDSSPGLSRYRELTSRRAYFPESTAARAAEMSGLGTDCISGGNAKTACQAAMSSPVLL